MGSHNTNYNSLGMQIGHTESYKSLVHILGKKVNYMFKRLLLCVVRHTGIKTYNAQPAVLKCR